MTAAYDRLPYPGGCISHTHPERLAVLARLRGLDPVAPSRARILEIGCAMGRNLAPLAEALPGAECVGIDTSAVHIEQAQALGWGLPNLRFLCADGADPALDLGDFDYILCHGVYSWVPAPVQAGLLAQLRARLRPRGLAYLSYNSLPGWHVLRLVRDLCRMHAAAFEDPAQAVAQARAAVAFFARSLQDDPSPYAALVRELERDLRTRDDAYLFHEHLSPHNEALYLEELVARAARAGLQVLGDADPATLLPEAWPEEVAATLRAIGTDQVQTEQYMDFLRCRTFRRSVLCPAEARPQPALLPQALHGLRVGGPFTEEPGAAPPWRFRVGELRVDAPTPLLRAALTRLGRAWPGLLPYTTLRDAALQEGGPQGEDALAPTLLACAVHGPAELRLEPEPWSRTPPHRPRAPTTARALAAAAPQVASWDHRPCPLHTPLQRALLPLLDGTRTAAELARALAPGGWGEEELAAQLRGWWEARLVG